MKKHFKKNSEFMITALLGLFVALFYAFLNISFDGPAYLADEIGYLLNAAALSGSKVDSASSYHFGYSLFLIPSFVFFKQIDFIWRSVQFTNAGLFGLSFSILYALSKYLVPEAIQTRRLIAVVICSLGPPWLIMSGYAFSNPAFTLIFLLSIWFLVKSEKKPATYLYVHSFLVGFLYWIHPTGLGVAVASLLSLIYLGTLKKDWKVIVFAGLIIVVVILLYRWLQPIFWSWNTPEGFAPSLHYPSITWDRISFAYIWSTFVRATGQITYITVGTLGFGLVGCWMAFRIAFTSAAISSKVTGLFLLLSLIGIIFIGALMLSAVGARGPDHWIYGRYLASALLPILLLGLLAVKTKSLAFPAFLIPPIFLLLSAITPDAFSINQVEPGWHINLINTPAFWVVGLSSSFGFAIALMAGAFVTAFALLLPNPLAKILVVIVFLFSISQGFIWHSRILSDYSHPSSIPQIIKDNWPPGTCIALNPVETGYNQEKLNLYKFHLHDYKIRRMHVFKWATNCNGPLITSDFSALDQLSDNILAREISTGLFLVSKNEVKIVEPLFGVYPKSHICTAFEVCVSKTAQDLNRMSLVGKLVGEKLNSDGRSGFLFFGPYLDLTSGRYKVKLDAEFFNLDNGFVDVVAGPDVTKIAQVNLFDLEKDSFEFNLQDNTKLVQIRLFVTENSKLSFHGYTLVGSSNSLDSAVKTEYPIILDSNLLYLPKILRKGWHDFKNNHIWSKSVSSLYLPIPNDCVIKACEAKLNFSVFGASPERPVSIYFDSAEREWDWSEKLTVNSDKSMDLYIPLSNAKSWRRINIRVPNAISPRRLGVSSDKRKLGISLQRIELIQR
jgi:hypothetical protein